MTITCGAAKKSIVPPHEFGDLYIAGYDAAEAPKITGLHDPIYIKAVVISDGTTKIALVSVDAIGLLRDAIEKVKERLDAWGFKRRNVFVFCTHTHAAPDLMGLWGPRLGVSGINKKYAFFVLDGIVSSVLDAEKDAKQVSIYFSSGSSKELIKNYRQPNDIDGSIAVLSLKKNKTTCIATIWTFTAQPEITARKNTQISADYPGIISARIEQERGGIALFGLGACGAQSPECCEQGFEKLDEFARKLYSAIKEAIAAETKIEDGPIEVREITGTLPVQNGNFTVMFKLGLFQRDMGKDGTNTATLSKWRVGNLHVVHLPAEPFPGIFERVIEPVRDSGQHVMIVSLTNDALGYVIPVGQFRLGRMDGPTKWVDPVAKKDFIGHEDESLGPDTGRIVKYALWEIFTYKTVLAIGVHADDLTIWAGGTIKRLSSEGNKVICARVCDDWEDCVGVPKDEALKLNRSECDAAYKLLGASEILHLGYQSDYLGGLSGEEYIVLRAKIVRLIRQYKPDIAIGFDLNGNDEENMDHVIVARAFNEACWQASFDALYPEQFKDGLEIHAIAERYLFARNPTVTNFYVDISDFIDDKVKAVCSHETVMKNFFHQYRLLARANKLHVDLLEDPKYSDEERANLLVKLLYGDVGQKYGVRFAEAFNKIDAGLLKTLARDES